MRRKWMAILLALCVLWGGTIPAAAAEEKAIVKFLVKEVSADGGFDLTVVVYNVKFSCMQFAIKYNSEAIKPVDEKGQSTDNMGQFAQVGGNSRWLTPIGMELDAQEGYFTFAGIIVPGERDVPPVDKQGCVTAGEEGIELFQFHFKKIGDAKPGFAIATNQEEGPFNKALPSGAALLNYEGDIPSVIEFDVPKDWGGNRVVDTPTYEDLVPGSGKDAQDMAREERLKNTAILQVGNSFAAVEGKLTPIYSGEPSVVAYAHDDRTFVPVRFVAESLGAKVGWDNETHTVGIEKGGHTVLMQVGETTYTIDGKEKTLDVPAEFKGDPGSANQRTMVPIRFVAEALDMDVKWDAPNNAVVLAPKAAPWNLNGMVEKEILADVLTMISPLVQGVLK